MDDPVKPRRGTISRKMSGAVRSESGTVAARTVAPKAIAHEDVAVDSRIGVKP